MSAAADPTWGDYALAKLEDLARERKMIHVDDLYAVIDRHPASPKSWGSVWTRAIKRGVIAKTGLEQPINHPDRKVGRSNARPVYRSLLYGRDPA